MSKQKRAPRAYVTGPGPGPHHFATDQRVTVSPPPRGCDLCGDFPVRVLGRCHPSAPLRAVFETPALLVLLCYLPECGREVARFALLGQGPEEEA